MGSVQGPGIFYFGGRDVKKSLRSKVPLLPLIVTKYFYYLLKYYFFFAWAFDDDDTFKYVFNMSNYNKDASPGSPHFTLVLLEEKKA